MEPKQEDDKRGMLFLVYVLSSIIIFLVAGYALFNQIIQINGTATSASSFSIVWSNPMIVNKEGATVIPFLTNGNTVLNISPKLEYPGAFVEVSVDIKNAGTVVSEITDITSNNPVVADINVSYTPNFALSQVLNPGQTTNVVVRVEYNVLSTNQNPINDEFGLVLEYSQKT